MPRRVVKKISGTIRKPSRSDTFDPNAIDGDNDGLVQEQTRFERPASPSISGSVSGRQMTPEMVERDKEIIKRRNDGQQVPVIARDMGISVATVNYALHRGRKRGEVTYIDTTNKPNPERDAEIVRRFNAGETQRSIANDLGMNELTVGTVINKARKRGESVPFRDRKKKRPNTAPEQESTDINKLVEELSGKGKSVPEIAEELGIKERDVVQALVQNRINEGVKKRKRSIAGPMSRPAKNNKKESIQKYLSKPSLEVDAESLSKNVGFFEGWFNDVNEYTYPPQKGSPKVVNWENHPQFGYELETGKPVEILASRADDNIEEVLKTGTYRTDLGGGNYGPGANLSFDGDPLMAEAYSDLLGMGESREQLESAERLIAKVSLKNPIVYNVGITKPDKSIPDSLGFKPDMNRPRSKRIATSEEYVEELSRAIGGDDKAKNLAQQIIDEHGSFFPEWMKKYELPIRELASGKIQFSEMTPGKNDIDGVFNLLARQNGHDGIVRLALGLTSEDSSHMIVFDSSSIKPLGKRKAYSKRTVDIWSSKNEATKAERRKRLEAAGYVYDEQSDSFTRPPAKEKQTQENKPPQNPGVISGSMSNENSRAGKKIKSSIKATKTDDKLSVDVSYGDIDLSFETNIDPESEWADAYDAWAGWRGNYGMRLASAVLMNEPLPKAAGYMGDSEGTHLHDLLSSGVVTNPARSEINDMTRTVKEAFDALSHIDSGKEVSTRQLFRGVSDVTSGDELMNLSSGATLTMPLSAFTSDMSTALYYATTSGNPKGESVIIELLPGAKVGYAAGEEYMHQFLVNGEWVTDVTENVTQGKFKLVGMSTAFIENTDGSRRKVKKIALEQIETFNPSTGKYRINTGKTGSISGAMSSSKKDIFAERLGNIRPIVSGLIMTDEPSIVNKAVDDYVKRNPSFIRQLAKINSSDEWKSDAAAVNPDGSRMSKEQYIKYVLDEQRRQAQEFVSNRVNKYSPVVDGWKLQQLRHNVEMTYAASPELVKLSEVYGFPQFAILGNQQIRQKDGSLKFVPNEEAHAKQMEGIGAGITFVIANLSAIQPYGDDAFIPQGMSLMQAMQDPRRVLNGQWGVSPETFLSGREPDPMWLHVDLIERHVDGYRALGRRPDITDVNSPLGTIRHEASHAIHGGAYARALLDTLENPNDQAAKERLSLLGFLMKPTWQAASAIDAKTATMMFNDSVSDYGASAPPEWLAETLSAALSPSRKTRALLNFNHRAILALIFPEISEYLMEGNWP